MICRSCSAEVEHLLDFGDQPIVNNLQIEPSNVRKFSIQYGGCSSCGLVQILDPIDPAEFYTNYANASSVKREPHLETLVEALKSRIPRDSKIIDIGCNDGKFLKRLRDCEFTELYGLEPTKNMSERATISGFRVFNTYLNTNESERIIAETGKFDCVIIRQVLEHIEDLANFGVSLRSLLKPSGTLVVEVPNAQAHFDGSDFALWEEHINEFNLVSLQNYLGSHGFKVTEKYFSQFSGINLTVFAHPSAMVVLEKQIIQATVDSFRAWANSFRQFSQNVRAELQEFENRNVPIAVYGVGRRSSFFLNVTEVINKISFAIDDDPNKQGKYLAGTSILVKSRKDGFSQLADGGLLLLGVNGENETELIKAIAPHKNWVFKSILPPSNNLLGAFSL